MKNLDKVIVIFLFFCLIGLVIWLSKEFFFIFLVLLTDNVTRTLLPQKIIKEKNTEKEEITQEEEKAERK